MRNKMLLLAGAFVFGVLLTISLSYVKAAGECQVITNQVGDEFVTKITFEYDCELLKYSNIEGASFADPNWSTSLSYVEPGGTGAHVTEPSPHTVAVANGAGLFPQGDYVVFDQPVSSMGFYYSASAPFVKLTAYDSNNNIVSTATGHGNWGSCNNYSCRCIYNPPSELCLYDEWDYLNIDAGENVITKVVINSTDIGGIPRGSTLVDDFTFKRKASLLPDLSVTKIDPIQVISDSDINGDGKPDLVQSKPAVVRVTLGAKNGELIDSDQSIEVKLEFNGQSSQSTTKTLGQLLSEPVDFFLTPNIAGDHLISVTVDSNSLISESNEENNTTSLTVTVKDTWALYIAHIPISLDGTPTNFVETSSNGADFLLGSYPLNPAEFTPNIFSNTLESTRTNIALDTILLWLYGKILSGGQADRIVGVVPKEYFEYYTGCSYPSIPKGVTLGNPTLGFTIPAVIILDGFWTSEAHEIGHTYGLGEEYQIEMAGPCSFNFLKEGEPSNGYWVESPGGEEHYRESLGFMGSAPASNSFNRWVTRTAYSNLFEDFRLNKNDPEVLLISGLVLPDGTLELQPLYRLPSGVIDKVEPGEFDLQLLDTEGNLIFEQSFGPANTAFLGSFPPTTLETSAFALTIPYLETATKIVIERGGEIKYEVDITTELLHDALDNIPDFGFVSNATQRRNALHQKVNALKNQISASNFKGALRKLQMDISPTLERWLVENYQVENPLQYSKEDMLKLIAELTEKLQNQLQ